MLILTVLPFHRQEELESAIPAIEVTKIALRLHRLIQEVIPFDMEQDQVTQAHSPIITAKVVQVAREAGGQDNQACVVFCLLINKRWFEHQSFVELWNSGLHRVRATACEVIAKLM